MFIITAKLDKKKVIAGAFLLVVLAALLILLLSPSDKAKSAGNFDAVVKTNAQRVEFLESFGWKVSPEPIEEQRVTIPKDFSKVYDKYNALQKEQGFDLKKYSGLEAVRYTYEITNHPSASGRVVADIIVYRNKIIAADIQCVGADGFMEGLTFPAA